MPYVTHQATRPCSPVHTGFWPPGVLAWQEGDVQRWQGWPLQRVPEQSPHVGLVPHREGGASMLLFMSEAAIAVRSTVV
jgi:hypothetical protein